MQVAKIRDSLLHLIFAKIDKNHDGLISYLEYLDWVRRFLAVSKYLGDEFYVPGDDLDLNGEDLFDIEKKPVTSVNAVKQIENRFNFSDTALAYTVR